MNEIDEIKNRIDIVDLTSKYLTLKKAGANFKAVCPFHNEKTPSLMISPEKQIFKCFGCFSKGTEVVLKNKLKLIEEIEKGDVVLTDKGNYKSVLMAFKREYKGVIVELKTRQNNEITRLTPDHNVLAIKTHNCKNKSRLTRLCQQRCRLSCSAKFFNSYKIEKTPISALKVNDYLLFPIDLRTKDKKTVRLYDRSKYLANKLKNKHSGFAAYNIPELVPIDDDLLKFLGYWIAEGSTYPRGIRFSLGSHESDFAKEICKLVQNIFGLKASIHNRNNGKTGIEISVSNILLEKIIVKLCGKGAENKKIPDFCMNLPVEKQNVLIEAILKGDGTIIKAGRKNLPGRKSITTISSLLIFQIKNILLRKSIIPAIFFKGLYKDKKNVIHRKSWKISWMPNKINNYSDILSFDDKKYWALPIREIKYKSFNGNVYNLMVKDDHTYVVKNFSVGNCGAGGSIFDFLMQMENLDFKEALQILAEQAGVDLKSHPSADYSSPRGSKDRLYALNRFVASFFHKVLISHPSGENALKYLAKREISQTMINDYQIGYAPRQKILGDYLKKYGYSDQEIKMAGSPTMFYNRIMFPIVDSIGNIIAFTGRVIDQGEPKYLNTPETKIFNKSKVLYGLNWARQAIKERDSVILVEGQTDVIFCQANGFINTIASSGTALTEEHLKILSRLTPNILLAYDQDMAGQKATKRAFEMAIELDLNVKIIEMPEGQDPADMIKNKPEEWKKAVSGAQRVIDYYLNRALKSNSKPYNVESKKKIAGEILPLVKIVVDPIEQSHYVQLLSQELGTSQSVILEAIGKLKKGPEEQSKKKEPEVKEAKKLTSSENLLGILIVHADLFKKYANALDEKMFDTEDSLNIYNVLKKAYTKIEVNRDFNVFEYLKKELPEELVNRINLIIFSLEEIGSNDPQIAEAELEGLILRFKLDKNSKLKGDYARQIAEAIKSGNRELAQKLNKELDNAIKKN